MEELAQKATIRSDTFRLPPAVSIVVVNSLETLLEERSDQLAGDAGGGA